MSHSRRHKPILGITKSKSEKDDKQRASMRERKKMKDKINPHLAADEDFDVVNYAAHPRSGQWVFAKDGKSYWNRVTAKDMRK